MAEQRKSERLGGPSLIEQVVLVLAVLLILEQHSRLPESTVFAAIFSGAVVVTTGIAYFARLAGFMVVSRHSGRTFRFRVQPALSWLVFPASMLLLLTSAATHWTASVRFSISKPQFDRLISQACDGSRPEGFPHWVGLYWIEALHDGSFDYSTQQGQIGFVTGVSLIDKCGIYYDQNDPKPSHWLTSRLVPKWYLTEW